MRVVVVAESKSGEKRVALLPDIISKLTRAGLVVAVESGAGLNAGANDKDFGRRCCALSPTIERPTSELIKKWRNNNLISLSK